MKEGGAWRLWVWTLLLAGNLCIRVAECQSRGDEGDSPQSLGFDDVLRRHDGYVKGETPTIPQTSFSCSAQPYNPGLYADMETNCQVYHVCFEDRHESFLCGPGTNFNQRILACDFWYNFDCQDSPSFYGINSDIGKVPDTSFGGGQTHPRPPIPRQPEQPPPIGSIPPRVSVPPPPPPKINIPPPPPPRVEPPRIPPPRIPPPQPQPPRIPPPQPQPPTFHPRPDISVKPEYPTQPSGHGSGGRQPYPPSIQQEDDSGFQFEGHRPQRPISIPPPPPPPRQPPQTHRPAFPPVVSPPRVSRPPLTPPVVRQPESSISRPRIPDHPDANLKGSGGYQPPQQPRIPQPSRPVGTEYPGYPISQRPIPPRPQPVTRPPYVPPPAFQQEHVDTEYIPPPPPQRPIHIPPPPPPQRPIHVPPPPPPQRPIHVPPPPPPQRPIHVPPPPPPQRPIHVPPPPPQRPIHVPPPPPPQRPIHVPPPPPPQRPIHVPPPPPPIQQEVTVVGPPPRPQRPIHVPPPVHQKPIEPDYGKPQPPVSPSIINEQQKPVSRPPSRPQVSVGSREPSRPKPVFPPISDHPNSNIKGGPGYNQPPPQIPRFEPTRIGRPSQPQGGYIPPRPVSVAEVKPVAEKRQSVATSGGYKPPQQDRIKTPSEPPREIYQPPIPVIDHPQSEIKGSGYREPAVQHQQRVKAPSTSTGVKRPQPQLPRAPVVVSRPQPPSLPATTVKKVSPVDSQLYEKPRPQPPAPQPGRIKQPSQSVQTVSRPSQPRFPSHQPVDHPNANVKGGTGYVRPAHPPSSPSTSYEQKTTSTQHRQPSGSGSSCGGSGGGCIKQIEIVQPEYKPQRIKTAHSSGVKTAGHRPHSASHQAVVAKQPNPEYEGGSSYTRGPEVYPKPEFGQPSSALQPVSTPSRNTHATKQGSPSQNVITQSQNKPAYQGSPAGTGFGAHVRPDYPFREVAGHQPPHQPQVFPHRDNPDHPNESLKGSNAYRPPPPAGFQGAASEVSEQQAAPEPEPASSSLLGDVGAE